MYFGERIKRITLTLHYPIKEKQHLWCLAAFGSDRMTSYYSSVCQLARWAIFLLRSLPVSAYEDLQKNKTIIH